MPRTLGPMNLWIDPNCNTVEARVMAVTQRPHRQIQLAHLETSAFQVPRELAEYGFWRV
jgi:hypothetical protein